MLIAGLLGGRSRLCGNQYLQWHYHRTGWLCPGTSGEIAGTHHKPYNHPLAHHITPSLSGFSLCLCLCLCLSLSLPLSLPIFSRSGRLLEHTTSRTTAHLPVISLILLVSHSVCVFSLSLSLSLSHYPRKIKFIHSFIHSLSLSLCPPLCKIWVKRHGPIMSKNCCVEMALELSGYSKMLDIWTDSYLFWNGDCWINSSKVSRQRRLSAVLYVVVQEVYIKFRFGIYIYI